MTALRCPLAVLLLVGCVQASPAEPLPNTQPLTAEGDLAAKMVAGIDKYLMRELAASVEKRKTYWKPDFSSPENYAKSVQPNRERLRKIIGAVDPRVPVRMELVATTDTPALVAEAEAYKVYAVRWPVFEGVDGEGLLLEPKSKPRYSMVAIPDADWTPEMLVGLAPGLKPEAQYARAAAENGCRVLVPVLIDRNDTWSGNPRIRMTNQPHREFLYRMSFEMGRHVIGYEVQKVLAAVVWLEGQHERQQGFRYVSVIGHGEGGLLALYAAALDDTIYAAAVSGYFGSRETMWAEPIYRNVWGLVREFGDAELAHLFAPHRRTLGIQHNSWPAVAGPPEARPGRAGAAPGSLHMPKVERVHAEYERIGRLKIDCPRYYSGGFGEVRAGDLLTMTLPNVQLQALAKQPPTDLRKNFDPAPRQKRQFDQLVNHTQKLLRDSESVRDKFFWSKIDTKTLDGYEKSTEPLRECLAKEVIGQLPPAAEKPNPRTRQIFDEPKWKGYEVTLDLHPDVFAYGILCVPKDLKPGEKRPVVVCQHGLEGRPQDVVNPKMKTRAYNSYGSQLADLGYIVYAPQNPYIGKDDFRVLQRKANPLRLSLFSFIVQQHQRTLDWLETLPYVDKDRIGFYGLSYGGKTAMRVPALEKRYCLSICSGDFNEWIAKNVSVDFKGSYMFTGEYEMFEFDLGHTFNYAEMAALIAPRPFMVERGHDDGVGSDEMVSYEFAKVRRLYSRLKLPERTEIEYFAGGHEIHAQGTYAFLKKHLGWPK